VKSDSALKHSRFGLVPPKENGQLKLVVQFSRNHLVFSVIRRFSGDFFNLSHPVASMQVFFCDYFFHRIAG